MYEVIKYIIIIFMILAMLSDIRTRTVSNKIIVGIAVASLAYIITHPGVGLLHPLVLVALWIAYRLHGIGGADAKVMIPLVFTLTSIQLYIFLILVTGVFFPIYFFYDRRVPFFAPLTIAYILVI